MPSIPNQYHVYGGGVSVSYYPDGFGPVVEDRGRLIFVYQDAHRSQSFYGDQVRTVKVDDLGMVVSVTLAERRPSARCPCRAPRRRPGGEDDSRLPLPGGIPGMPGMPVTRPEARRYVCSFGGDSTRNCKHMGRQGSPHTALTYHDTPPVTRITKRRDRASRHDNPAPGGLTEHRAGGNCRAGAPRPLSGQPRLT